MFRVLVVLERRANVEADEGSGSLVFAEVVFSIRNFSIANLKPPTSVGIAVKENTYPESLGRDVPNKRVLDQNSWVCIRTAHN